MPTLYPDHIDPLLCTHIHYAFADINPLTLAITPTEEHDIHWTDRLGMVKRLLTIEKNKTKRNKRRILFVRLATLSSNVRIKTTKSEFKNSFICWRMVREKQRFQRRFT